MVYSNWGTRLGSFVEAFSTFRARPFGSWWNSYASESRFFSNYSSSFSRFFAPSSSYSLAETSFFNRGYNSIPTFSQPITYSRPISVFSGYNYYRPQCISAVPSAENSLLSRFQNINLFRQKTISAAPVGSRVATTVVHTAKNPVYKIGKFDLNYWKSLGYNHEKGKQLAMDAVRTCKGAADGGCVGYTRRTINRIYGTDFKNAGAAYNFGNKILSDPRLKGKFKKVDIKNIEKAGVPDGAIVLWKPGAPGYTRGLAAKYGHGAIVYQNKAYSDCVVRNLSTCFEIWIPV